LEDETSRVNKENAVGVRVDLELGHTLLRGILLVFGIVVSILNETVKNVDACVEENYLLEDYELLLSQNNVAYRAVITNDINF
jgi:hypothetical protein